ncbi:MAG TPA: HigA family addiction module antitoxin [Mycobacteriales bacterium]|nr:HigA family addiction module antitoxin [Mycobacteriales bacterium]
MANEPTSGWQPDWAVAPGEILLEALQDRGMTQSELARRMARPPKTINEIIKGKAAITAETAIQLERTLGISARFWTGLEATFREHMARHQAQEQLEANASWVDGFPLNDLIRHHLIQRGATKATTLAELLSFFRLSSPDAFERHWLEPGAAFRSSPTFMASPKAVAAWLRWGEIEATEIADAPPFDALRFRQVLDEIRPMTRRDPFMQIFNRVKAMCAEAGVIVILTPELAGTHLSGAARWVGGRPVIQLSLRHKSDDHFWFTFFHEAGHILTSPRRRQFVDTADLASAADPDVEEETANRFARNCLLPPHEYQAFVDGGDFSESAVRAFAQAQRIAPGIVVGRLQRDNKVPRSHLNSLKRRIHWPADNGPRATRA